MIAQRWKIDILQLGRNSYISKTVSHVHFLALSAPSICALSHQSLTSQVWVFQRHQQPPWLELSTGKCCATFGLSGGDVLLCHQDKNQDTHTHGYCNTQKTFSVGFPQTSDFCQRCRLKCCSRGNMRWRLCHLLLTGVMFLSVLKMWKEMSRWRERREERLVLAAPGGSWVWCFSMQLLPNTHTLPVGVCVRVCLLFVYRFSVSLPHKG